MKQNWIWLDPARYPDSQTTVYNGFCDKKPGDYAVCEFVKSYTFTRKIRKATLTYSGDTEFRLYCNGRFVATGPANVGGDFFIDNEKPWPTHFTFTSEVYPEGNALDFHAWVKMMPVRINEFSKGHGGFMLYGLVELADGTTQEITTDSTWLCRQNHAYTAPDCYDGGRPVDEYSNAVPIENIWHATPAPIPPRTEEDIGANTFTVAAGTTQEFDFEYPRIYSCFIHLLVKTESPLHLTVQMRETEKVEATEHLTFTCDTEYISPGIRSIGGYHVIAENRGDTPAEVTLSMLETHFPITGCAMTETSDEDLNLVLDVCRHTLKQCMQMFESESTLHCEPLACTGDYYVEAMMTAMSYGDLRLAEFDVLRTADILRVKEGVMFHTTYSMIWVMMLYDLYRFTGHTNLLRQCADALEILLERMHTYVDDSGIVENPPSFMFVDWVIVDGMTLHRPPKALGQTYLSMFYYGGLIYGAKIYDVLGDTAKAELYRRRAADLKTAINALLYDPERELYFEGLNTPSRTADGWWLPQNVEKRYYRLHSNVLAALFGVHDNPADLLTRTLEDDSLGYFQPYFAHFVLEAVRECGLTHRFSREILDMWKKPILDCPKGLPEGFIYQENYGFDHSHGWGGTPLYHLPMVLSGLEILEPGYRRIRLNPDLLGFAHANVEIPTPYGTIRIEMQEGKEPIVTLPDGIIVEE